MALTNTVNLKLMLTAQNDAESALDALNEQIKAVSESWKSLTDLSLGDLTAETDALGASLDDLTKSGDTAKEALTAIGDLTIDDAGLTALTDQMAQLTSEADSAGAALKDAFDTPGKSASLVDVNDQLETAATRADALKASLTAALDGTGSSEGLVTVNDQLATASDRADALKATLTEALGTAGESAALMTVNDELSTADDRVVGLRASVADLLAQAGTSLALQNLNDQATTLKEGLTASEAGLDAVLAVTGDSPALTDITDQLVRMQDAVTAAETDLQTLKATGGDSVALTDMQAQLTQLTVDAETFSAALQVALTSSLAPGKDTSGLLSGSAESESVLNAAMAGTLPDFESLDSAMAALGAQASDTATAISEAADKMGTAGDAAAGSGTTLAAGESGSSTSLMGVGMTALMADMAVNMLSSSTGEFATIQQMQQLMKSTPNQAAQEAMLLGAGGITGSSAASFMSSLSGNIRTALQPVNGTMSREGVLLQSLGIGQAQSAQSPQYLLNDIASQYQKLIGAGRSSTASQLLQLTGTSQLAEVFANWGAMNKQADQTNLGMTPKQLGAAAQSSLSLQMSLQQLSLAFAQMAIQLVPLLNPLIKGLGHLTAAFAQAITSVEKMFRTVSTSVTTGKGMTLTTNPGLEAIAELKAFVGTLGSLKIPSLKDLSGLAGGASDPLLSLFDDMLKPLTEKKTGLGQSLSTTFGKLGTDALAAISASLKTNPVKAPAWLTDLGTHIANDLKTAGSSLTAKKTGIQATLEGWATTAVTDLQVAFRTIHPETQGPLTTWANQAYKDLQTALMTVRKETSTPIANWANAAFGDLKAAYAALHAETKGPMTGWAGSALSHLTNALSQTYASIATPLGNWVTNLVSHLGSALQQAYSSVASTITSFGETIALDLTAAIHSMLASVESITGNAISSVPGAKLLAGGAISGLHSASSGNANESAENTAQAAMLNELVNQFHFSAAQASQAAGSVHAKHSGSQVTNLTVNVNGLSKGDKAIAKQVATQIVQNLKVQGNVAF